MLKNYLLAAYGSAKRNSLGLTINLFGLAMSLAALIIIVLFVKRELMHDTTHPHSERVYRITQVINSGSFIENSSSCPFPVKEALENDFESDLEMVVRIFDFQIPEKSMKLENNELYKETGIYYADSTFFEMFDFPLITGDKKTVLAKPFSMVLSKELAEKWFPGENPMGKTVKLAGQDQLACEITGVYEAAGPSHILPKAIISMSTTKQISPWMSTNWVWNPCWTYLRLKENIRAEDFERKLPAFVQKNYPELNRDMVTHSLQPISEIHLTSKLEFELSQNSDIKYLYIFISSAILLIIIAGINFLNLNSIYFIQRIREIGVRKLSGASRTQINFQFIIESIIMTITAFILCLVILSVTHPLLGRFLDLNVSWIDIFDPIILLILLATVVVLGAISGYFPATIVSGINEAAIFKSGLKGLAKGKTLRKSLVIFQFSLAISIMIFTLMATKQLNYMQTRDNGFDAGNIITLSIVTTPIQVNFEAFKNELLQNPNIAGVTVMNEVLGINNNNHEFSYDDMKEGEWKYFPALIIDEDIVETFGIEIIAGRAYSKEYQNEDSLSIIINQSMAEYLGYMDPNDIIGKDFKTISGSEKIIGVTKNFNYKSLHNPVGPFVLDIASNTYGHKIHFSKYVAIRVNTVNSDALKHIETTWNKFVTNAPFDYHLLSNDLQELYKGESRMSKVLFMFSALSVIIACLGLFGLTWFMSQSKSKELAIRQTLGGSFAQLIYVATKEQMTLVSIAVLIAIPFSIIGIGRWLESFAYRIGHDPFIYIFSSIIALVIAFATIFYLAWKVSVRNPSEVLKYE